MTTLMIDEDVLARSQELAERRKVSIGAVLSELARDGLSQKRATEMSPCGFEVFSKRGLAEPITMELVNRLRDEAP